MVKKNKETHRSFLGLRLLASESIDLNCLYDEAEYCWVQGHQLPWSAHTEMPLTCTAV